MYKRKAVVRAEKGQLKGISESITGDYEDMHSEEIGIKLTKISW